MTSKLSGQPALLATMPKSLHPVDRVDETWFKQKTWVCIPNSPEHSPHPVSSCTRFYSPIRLYRKLIQQSRLLQVQEQATCHWAIALRQISRCQSPSSSGDSSSQVDQLKDTFLSTISHELRTPISTIKMAIQMLTLALSREGLLSPVEKPSLSSNKIAHYLKILNDECNREIGLITDLLDLQRLEAATHPVNLQPIVLEPYLHRIICPFQEQAQTQQQVLALDAPPDLPVLVSDAQILERILVELLTNACKYTPPLETIRVSLSLRPLENLDSQVVVFKVCNSGVELLPEQLARIFEKFYRIPTSDPHKHAGTGLGLALVKKLVAQLGGTIRAESAAQQTCFAVELPISSTIKLPLLASASIPVG